MSRNWNRRDFVKTALAGMAFGPRMFGQSMGLNTASSTSNDSPNILWLVIEDTSSYQFGCYGSKDARTPVIDALAERGIQFMNAWSTAPQCSPARSTIISGSYATTYGTEYHRRRRAVPQEQYFFPPLLRQAGYYCTNNSKTDYNAGSGDVRVWDENNNNASYNSSARKPNQPFFSVFNSNATHMGRVISITTQGRRDFAQEGLDPATMDLPPHVPDLPEVRSDYAFHQEGVNDIDTWVGFFLEDLKEKGLDEDTIIFFYSDHGGCLPRGKGFLFETGLKVPMIVYVPPKWRHLCSLPHGQKSPRLVGFVDLAPTILSLAGIAPPDYMQGQAFMGKHEAPRRTLQFGLRANQDDHYDPWRAVTDGRYTYIRCYTPYKPMAVRNFYQWKMPANLAWDAYVLSGECTRPEWSMTHKPKPIEMLFDTDADPHCIHNLAKDSTHLERLIGLRKSLSEHIRQTHDLGFFIPSVREKGQPLYTWVRQTEYNLERLLDAAEMACAPGTDDVACLLELLGCNEAEVRFWAASGFATLGCRNLLSACPEEVIAAIEDADPYVAATAAEAACYLGRTDRGLPALIAQFKEGTLAAYSSLETLSLHSEMRETLMSYVSEFEQLAERGRSRVKARSILVNLGRLPISALFPGQREQVNRARRPLGPRP